MPIIVKDLKHIYSKNGPFERVAINDISFEIEDGSFIGVIGHTGSGKSTLIQHLNGLLKADSGTIIINGCDITKSDVDIKKIRSQVGVVFQYPEYQLFEETVYKDIAYGPKNLGFTDEEISKAVYDSLDFVGLDISVLQKSPFELSGGQKRRVAIAGILAMNPSVLILDEPTAGLDPMSRNDLLQRLKTLHETKKVTIILVSHSMEDIASTVEKVMVMSEGKLIAFDTVSNIFSNSDKLLEIGLGIPQITLVLKKLKEQGFNMPYDGVYSVEEAADIIYKLIKGDKNA